MIKKMTSLAVPVAPVQEVFNEIEAWPQWMPAIRRVRVLQKTESLAQVEVRSVMLGMEFDQTVEFRLQPGRVNQKQIAGRFKKWEADWRFLPSPDGNGTTLSVTLDIDFGILGMFVPQQKVANAVNEWFTQLAQKTEERTRKRLLQRPPAPSAAGPSAGAPAEIVLQVYQTTEGLEVWIGQQRFFIPASS
jgi:ribosome-associated toxin RatA of RatAB toxin-antitoxin module